MKPFAALALAAMTAAVPACHDESRLTAHSWHLLSAVDGKGRPIRSLVPEGPYRMRIDFKQGKIETHGGCNRMYGLYKVTRNTLRVMEGGSTLRGCGDRRLMRMDDDLNKRLWTGTLQYEFQVHEKTTRLS